MTTPTLTREQVAVLRYRALDDPAVNTAKDLAFDLERAGYLDYHYMAGRTINDAGREALAAYDRENITVLREDLETAVAELQSELEQYDDLWDGRAERMARRDDDRAALARLRAALETK